MTILGGQAQPGKKLEAFPNRAPDRFYLVSLHSSEFTCLCPKTGQPDFATIHVDYVPDQKVVEAEHTRTPAARQQWLNRAAAAPAKE